MRHLPLPPGSFEAFNQLPLPSRLTVPLKRREGARLFAASVERARVDFDVETLRTLLGEAARPDVAVRLKTLRQNTAAVRSLFYVYDEEHAPPRRFDRFVRSLGKLNDAIAAGDEARVDEQARRLAKLAGDANLERATAKFTPSRGKRTAAFLERQASLVADAIEERTLAAERFHEVRKSLKHFMNVFKTRAAVDPGSADAAEASQYLLTLNDGLGAVQDRIAQMRGAGAEELAVEIDPELRGAVRRLFKALKL